MNRLLSKIYFLIIAISTAVFAQGTISIDSKVDRADILIGDVFTYTVNVIHAKDVQVQTPSLAENLGMFEIRDYKVNEPVEHDGELLEKTEYLLSTFDTGEYEIPPLEIGYTIGLDTVLYKIKTQAIAVNVASLNPDEAGDIRDIKPPIEPDKNYTQLIILISAIVLAIVISILLFYYIKRRKQGKALIPRRSKPPRPAHEVALEDLQKLVDSDLRSAGKIKQYYIELSEITRVYIENRFSILSLEMTTDQLLEEMTRENLAGEYIDMMRPFLVECDFVKFAKYIPSEETTDSSTQIAFDFVEKSQVVFEPPVDDAEKEEEEKPVVESKEPAEIEESVKAEKEGE